MKQSGVRRLSWCFLVFSGVILSGCVTPPGTVAKDWSRMLREMQVTAVFPPRVDMQVGDVYSDPYPTGVDEDVALKGNGFLQITHLLSTVDLTAQIATHYAGRFVFPKTPDDPKKGEEPAPVSGKPLFAKGDHASLPIVGFPEFSYLDVTSANLGALIPLQGIPVGLRSAFSDYKSASIKLRSSESYGVPRDVALAEFKKKYEDSTLFARLNAVWPKGYTAKLITEVFLAREIEISVVRKETFGASASTPGQGGQGLQEVAGSEQQDRVKQLNAINDELKSMRDAGGFFQLSSVSDSNITMKRVYTRPLVIGVKFIRLVRDPKGELGVDFGDLRLGQIDPGTTAPLRVSGAPANVVALGGEVTALPEPPAPKPISRPGDVVAAAPPPPRATAASPPPVAATVPTYQPAPIMKHLSKIYFSRGASLDEIAKRDLDRLVAIISRLKVDRITIVGHEARTGNASHPKGSLSLARAGAVRDYLVMKGVDNAQIFIQDKGDSQPAESNATKEGRAKNRRVDIDVTGTAKN